MLVTEVVTLTAGIENLLDKKYQGHLTGYNRAANEDIAIDERLPGTGRSLYAQVRWVF